MIEITQPSMLNPTNGAMAMLAKILMRCVDPNIHKMIGNVKILAAILVAIIS